MPGPRSEVAAARRARILELHDADPEHTPAIIAARTGAALETVHNVLRRAGRSPHAPCTIGDTRAIGGVSAWTLARGDLDRDW